MLKQFFYKTMLYISDASVKEPGIAFLSEKKNLFENFVIILPYHLETVE